LTLEPPTVGRSPDDRHAGVRTGVGDPDPSFTTVPGGGLTLDELISSVWEGLTARETVACPVCGERMLPSDAGDRRPDGGDQRGGAPPSSGKCSGCGAVLS
jgi:hypothetical protein